VPFRLKYKSPSIDLVCERRCWYVTLRARQFLHFFLPSNNFICIVRSLLFYILIIRVSTWWFRPPGMWLSVVGRVTPAFAKDCSVLSWRLRCCEPSNRRKLFDEQCSVTFQKTWILNNTTAVQCRPGPHRVHASSTQSTAHSHSTIKCNRSVTITKSYSWRWPSRVETCRSVLQLMIKLSLCICCWLVFLYNIVHGHGTH
jgi:hypothetical protein